ncbi:MAG TPA: pseudouridine-5'-phosphate glycosidase [Candidatus Limnocylindrales bacterium]|nr:pseudouridine-5'-phosphate glycosidase [Candidatus Limnocylindrales bacterium]
MASRLEVFRDVEVAMAAGRPTVALESTLIAHGLPHPQNLDVALACGDAIRESGGEPATIAIHDGKVHIGLDDRQLLELATAPAGSVMKAARASLAEALDRAGWSATTVSATMIAARAAGIDVFATGGIGGVHRGASRTFDISSDLEELARTGMAVVCAGPKSILDAALTLEYLETRGVPVVTIGQDDLPGFYARSSGLRSPSSVPDVAAAAQRVRTHLGLGLRGGILVCVPVPEADALPEAVASAATDEAVAGAETAGIRGPDLTPWLLARVGELTGGASIRANTALIVNNARVAGQIAAALASSR